MNHSITGVDQLRARIEALESLRLQQEHELRVSARAAIDSIRPSQLIRNAVSKTLQTPGIGKSVLKGAAGLAAGYVAKKLMVRSTTGVAKKAAGTLLQVGLAKAVTANASRIVNAGANLFKKWFRKAS